MESITFVIDYEEAKQVLGGVRKDRDLTIPGIAPFIFPLGLDRFSTGGLDPSGCGRARNPVKEMLCRCAAIEVISENLFDKIRPSDGFSKLVRCQLLER